MHDAKNRPLKVGDLVLIAATITSLSPSEDYCNVSAASVFGRKPTSSRPIGKSPRPPNRYAGGHHATGRVTPGHSRAIASRAERSRSTTPRDRRAPTRRGVTVSRYLPRRLLFD
jgi:hypothetical protein